MKQAVCLIYLLTAGLSIFVISKCHSLDDKVIAEQADISNIPYMESYLEMRDGINLDKDHTIEFSANYDTIYVTANQIKKVCIRHLDAIRCADSLLLWELISKMEETK